ncbi:MAG: hypothetical protein K1060chlam1_00066 [Candidatus Anoxychlamydiales bacterium]|nr:hypothetical protein [Candidatus Anoxychlamydiales bacterium]
MSFSINLESNRFWYFQIPTLLISTHVTRGLCKIAGYECLAHATSFTNYISILKSGGNPSKGGETTKLAVNSELGDRANNYFYVFRDSTITLQSLISPEGPQSIREKIGVFCVKSIYRRIFPFPHSYYSYIAQCKKKHSSLSNISKWIILSSIFCSIFTPQIRFIYTLEEISTIAKDDDDYAMGLAYKTSHHLPCDRIGILGFLKHLQKDHILKHINNHPSKVIQGIGQFALGIFLTYKGLGLFF